MTVITDDILLLNAATTDGDKTAAVINYPNKRARIYLYGTPDGATAKLQCSPDGTTYVDLDDINGNAVSFTAAGTTVIEVAVGESLRANVASAGASTSLTMWIRQL